jgi:membrane-bound serine protease (ClpP class)
MKYVKTLPQSDRNNLNDKRMKFYLFLFFFCLSLFSFAQKPANVFVFDLRSEVGPALNRHSKLALEEATRRKADFVVIDLDTYGGILGDGDEIRTRILEFPKPVYVFVNKNAASAGALISIACDKIFMAPGASIGAATVVMGGTQTAAPDKYQSYMRSLMRTTAEANHRDPRIAEGMVDEELEIDSLKPIGRVLTLTTSEAIRLHYCEGEVNSVEELLKKAEVSKYQISRYQIPVSERIVSFFMNPAVSSLLILCIVGGLYFELQSPGLILPIVVSGIALVLYLVPYYLSGLAANWEIVAFGIGVVLLGIEIFAIPGFGITGICGLILIFGSLLLMMLNNDFFNFDKVAPGRLSESLLAVLLSFVGAVALIVVGGKKLLESKRFKRMTLQHTLDSSEGYTSNFTPENLLGKQGLAYTVLRPSGKVIIDGTIYDATTRGNFVDKDTPVEVIEQEGTTLRVKTSPSPSLRRGADPENS